MFLASSPFCAHASTPDTKAICGVTIKDIAHKPLENTDVPKAGLRAIVASVVLGADYSPLIYSLNVCRGGMLQCCGFSQKVEEFK